MSEAEGTLKRKALMAGMPYSTLLNVYRRGIGAWKTNPESVRLQSGEKNYSASRAGKMGKEQWAMARVNAFIDKRPSVYRGADDDLRRRAGLK
jgi:hypothetical protein